MIITYLIDYLYIIIELAYQKNKGFVILHQYIIGVLSYDGPPPKLRLMKKLVLLFGTIMLVTVFFSSCQKEQTVAETPEAATERNVVGVAGVGPYEGSITPSYAASLAANYVDKYGNKSIRVEFKAKDLVAFINGLQAKYKSDVIYVNFGVYGKGAEAVNNKDNGRLTVFFTGNKIPAPSTSRRTDGTSDGTDEFLNHGGIYP